VYNSLPKCVSRNWKLGFGLALTAAVLWGILPIALKVALTELDAWTLTWYRFAGAMVTVGTWLAVRGRLPPGSSGQESLAMAAAGIARPDRKLRSL
jgi:drug/metabolite transporter (DMT)-like permease